MAIGERIRFFRLKRRMTRKQLGVAVGFPEKNADVRMIQYETGTRSPKSALTSSIAKVLDVAPEALDIPNIEEPLGIMHTLFALEDIYNFKPDIMGNKVSVVADKSDAHTDSELASLMTEWAMQMRRLQHGEITREQYDEWRCHLSYQA